MKRLNRKGFTLVELLAVIVILAIVVGITLVTVLPTLKKSRQSAFNLTAQTAADYYEKQYQLYITVPSESIWKNGLEESGAVDYDKAGLKESNYTNGTYSIDTSTGRVCVKLTRNSDAGSDYYDANDDNGFGTGVAASTACPAE